MTDGGTLPRRNVLAGMGAIAAAGATTWAGGPAHAATAPHRSTPAGTAPERAALAQQVPDRPNILVLVSEDNAPLIGAYGDPVARTPNLDAMAAQGIRYDKAYTNVPVCAPTRFALITGMYPESAGPAHHMRALAEVPAYVRGIPEYLREAGYYCTNNYKTDYNTSIDMAATWDDSSDTAHWQNRPDGAPFYSVFNIEVCHEGRLFDADLGDTSPDDVTVPSYLPDTPEVRRDLAAYYHLLFRMDRGIGNRLAELDEAGLAEDTIVIYHSDNGGVHPRSKRFCYEQGMRIPLIVRIPPRWAHLAPVAAGSVVDTPVSLIDLAPTVLALTGVPAPDHLHGTAFLGPDRRASGEYAFGGRARMDERLDLIRTVTDGRYRYIRNYSPHRPWGQHIAYAWQQKSYQVWERAHRAGELTGASERFWQAKPAEELYDLDADPEQLRNLADDAGHASVKRRLHDALRQHMIRVNDNGFIPEGSPVEGYVNSRRAGAYPIAKVIELADAAIARDVANLVYFAENLLDGNEVVRFWAAQGLLMLGERAAPATAALMVQVGQESSPYVRVALAEGLASVGEPARAAAVLGDLLGSGEGKIRLLALNALTFIGPAAQPALPMIESAAAGSEDYLHRAGLYLQQMLSGQYQPGSVVP